MPMENCVYVRGPKSLSNIEFRATTVPDANDCHLLRVTWVYPSGEISETSLSTTYIDRFIRDQQWVPADLQLPEGL